MNATFFIGQVLPDVQPFDIWAQQPLLMALESGGIDWPSSCRSGTCRTCIGELVSGEVHYKQDGHGLSAEDKALGFVLPCVACADSAVVLRRAE